MAKKQKKAKPVKKAVPKKKSAASERQERVRFNAPINEEDKSLFLHHLPLIATARDRITKATNDIRKLYKTAKSDGFVRDDFEQAFAMQSAEGEKKCKAAIARSLTIARYLGLSIGGQHDLFLDTEPGQLETAERSFEVGKQDAQENKKADATGFDEQEYLKGYHSISEARVKKGIKEHPEVKADQAQTTAQKAKNERQRAKDADAFTPPPSGVSLTRAQYNAMQEQQGKPPAEEAVEPEPTSMFSKRDDAAQTA